MTLDWERLQEEVGHSFPNIAPFLEMGRLVAIEGNAVTIGFGKQATVARAMLEKADNIQSLTSLCERMSGQPVRVRVVELTDTDPPGPTMAQIRAAKEQEQKLVLLERAKAHPVVKQALEIFGAELADVRTIVESTRGAGMKNPLGNMANLMKQAQAMQAQMAKLQEEAATKTVTGTAGGGMVRSRRTAAGDRERRDQSGGRRKTEMSRCCRTSCWRPRTTR